ncbi:MAG: hypothetical protein R2708_24240 [Vicinamibacterales bacterium]
MSRRSGARALVVALVMSAPHVAGAQPQADPVQNRPVIEAERLREGETVVIDGALDEAVWKRAVPVSDFKQRDPRPGDDATERTEVRVAIDGRRLLIGVVCFDSEPDRLLANQMQRDQPFSGDDRFLWGLDTYLDGRTGVSSSRSTPPARWATGW